MIRSKISTAILRDVAQHNRWQAINWIQRNKENISKIEETGNLELLQHLINFKKLRLESETILEEMGEM